MLKMKQKMEKMQVLNDGADEEDFKVKRQEKMDPAQRDAYQTLLKELESAGEEADSTRQILQLALQLDEKGEFYKFIEVFGSEEPRLK